MRIRTAVLASTLLAGSYAPGAMAQDWDYSLGIYLWGTGIEGESGVGPVTAPVSITFSDALDNLDSALMLNFQAHNGQRGLFVDVMHIGLDPEASLPNGASLAIDLTNNVYEFGGSYRLDPDSPWDMLAGIRYTELEIEGTVPGIGGRSIVDESWTDFFIGTRVIGPLGDGNWRFRGRADIGTGDSDFVWNALLGLDYAFSDSVSASFGYRWLDYDYDNGKRGADRFTYDARYEGPFGLIAWTW